MTVLCHEAGLPKGSGPPKMPWRVPQGAPEGHRQSSPSPLAADSAQRCRQKGEPREVGESEAHSKPKPDSRSLTLPAGKARDPGPSHLQDPGPLHLRALKHQTHLLLPWEQSHFPQ